MAGGGQMKLGRAEPDRRPQLADQPGRRLDAGGRDGVGSETITASQAAETSVPTTAAAFVSTSTKGRQ
jgi:hypothetical protein